ncbi:MAG TPA: glycosyltransferase [Candidatus Acidoferrales bacterium]
MSTREHSISGAAEKRRDGNFTICHFTTAHTELKSRSFHREFIPLAQSGVGIRYLAPVKGNSHRDGIDIIALKKYSTRLRRIFAQPALLRTLLQQRATLYHFQDPELLPLAFVLKLICRKRVVYDAYEDFPSMAANKAGLPGPLKPLAAKAIANMERLAIRLFDGVMTADPFTMRRLAKSRSPKIVFYNFPNLDFFPSCTAPRTKPFDLVYRGGLSQRAGTFVLIEALRLLATRDRLTKLLLIGYFDNASAEKTIRQRIHAAGVAHLVEIRSRLDHEKMAEALSEATIGINPLQAVPKFMLNIPVKVFEYWACGLPVVSSDLPPIRPFFRNAEAGLLFPAQSAQALAQSITWLLDNPYAAAAMGARGRDLVVRRFNNLEEVRKLQRFFARVAEDPMKRTMPEPGEEVLSACSNLL